MKLELKDIFISEKDRIEMQDTFSCATGFGVVFVDNSGNHISPNNNFTKFCAAINETPHGRECCRRTNCYSIENAMQTGRPDITVCHAGMVNIEIPLIYEGQHLGGLTAGQVLCTDMDRYPKAPITADVNWLDSPQLAEYFREVPTLTPQQIEGSATTLFNLANYLIQRIALERSQTALQQSERKRIKLEHMLTTARLESLQKQVTPHFIFNTITAASRLISLQEYDTAQQVLDAFASMMRYSLSNLQDSISLEQELDYIRSYLSIQELRFSSRIQYHITCEPTMKDLQIPFFCLQPLVENAVEHGLFDSTHGLLSLSCYLTSSAYHIVVKDNGVGIPTDQLRLLREQSLQVNYRPHSGQKVGLYNSYNRLKLMFQSALSFQLDSTLGKGTCVHITIQR